MPVDERMRAQHQLILDNFGDAATYPAADRWDATASGSANRQAPSVRCSQVIDASAARYKPPATTTHSPESHRTRIWPSVIPHAIACALVIWLS